MAFPSRVSVSPERSGAALEPGPGLAHKKRPPLPHNLRMLLAALGLLAISAGYVSVKRAGHRSAAGASGGPATIRVTRGDLRQSMRLSGAITAKGFATIVAPRLAGGGPRGDAGSNQMILIKMIKPGSRVKKGDVVAEFDRQWQLQRVDDQQAEVVQAEAAIAKRKAELDIDMEAARQSVRSAKADHDKAHLDLKTSEIRAAIDAEKLKLAVDEAAARYKQLEEEVRLREASYKAEIRSLEIKRQRAKIDKARAQTNADKMLLRAPIDGVAVTQMTFRGGQFGQVQEGDQLFPGTPFLQIVDTSTMVLSAAANQAESQDLRIGQRADISLDAYPGQVFRGRLVAMGAMASGSISGMRGGSRALYVRQIPVRFLIDGSDSRIMPDLSASASVVLEEEKDAVLAPVAALEREKGEYYIRVKTAGGWEKRRVEVALANNTQAAIRAGLNANEEVALGKTAAHERE